jgi:hypothetical protein
MGKRKKAKSKSWKAKLSGVVKSKRVTDGAKCPKCPRMMERRQHLEKWKPKPHQPFYFSYWDVCTPCRHIQHYEAAKIWVGVVEPEPIPGAELDAEFRAVMGCATV